MSLRPPPGWDAPPLPARDATATSFGASPFFPEPGSAPVRPVVAPVPVGAPLEAALDARGPLGDVRGPLDHETTAVFVSPGAPVAPGSLQHPEVPHDLGGGDRVTPVMGSMSPGDPYGAAYPTPVVPPAASPPSTLVEPAPTSRPSVSEALRARLAPTDIPLPDPRVDVHGHQDGFVLGPGPDAVPPPSGRRAAAAAAAGAPPVEVAVTTPPRIRLGLIVGVTVFALAVAGLVSFFVLRGSSSSAPADDTAASASAKPSKRKKTSPAGSATPRHSASGIKHGGAFRGTTPRGPTPPPPMPTGGEPTDPVDDPEGEAPSPYAPTPPRGH